MNKPYEIETVMRNAGYDFKVFHDESSAIDWLKERSVIINVPRSSEIVWMPPSIGPGRLTLIEKLEFR